MQNATNWEVIADQFNAECRARKASAASRKSVNRVANTGHQKNRAAMASAKRFFAMQA